MRIALITAFPPSTGALSSFGFHAAMRFLQSPRIDEILVIGDTVSSTELKIYHPKLRVLRCWKADSVRSLCKMIMILQQTKPDVIWLNYQYTLFGTNYLCILIGLMLPAIFRVLKLPTVLLLHNYLAVVNLTAMNLPIPPLSRTAMGIFDKLGMKSLSQAAHTFLMMEEYVADFSRRFPRSRVSFVEQDLFEIPSFHSPPPNTHHVLTLGSFGTYKKLEILLEAFSFLTRMLPTAKLTIAGRSHPFTPTYLDSIALQAIKQASISFVGYIPDEDIPELFWASNVVVVTNETCTGSSGVVRHAARLSRGMIAPNIAYYRDLAERGWGIRLYEPGNNQSLAEVLYEVLTEPNIQHQLAKANYVMINSQSKNMFIDWHLDTFFNFS